MFIRFLGKFGIKNFKKVCQEVDEHISDEDLRGMMEEFDKNKDGFIDLLEFK